ncbi:MAG: glutamine--tRNA ligase/YqeY domain fusion protein [Candidatus Latescibacteria bacterium]|nr:glutamine--tRNA ligase/YqeY domain fusion protein [Candidatus Latescibacterota bacterium]
MTTETETDDANAADRSRDFLREAIAADLEAGKATEVVTRFPPEPNAYLHIGNAKAICINFGIAAEFGGRTNLRFDDTNPVKEEQEYVDSMLEDIRWLGYDFGEALYASDYFEQLYEWACELIGKGLAYVDDQSAEEIRANRGTQSRAEARTKPTQTEPGRNSPYRDRSPEENLDLFQRMRAGEFADGDKVLRAKIDMASPNLNLRDPVMYRILHAHHHRTGDTWCIYPLYDWAHGQSDSIEGVTHSLCSLEFESNRPLYDWYIEQLGIFPSRQIEFARGNITYTVTSKRRLLQVMESGHMSGWDDPRLPTLRGMRRRGVPPEAIRRFWSEAGIAKRENNIEVSLLEFCIRNHLNKVAPRVMGVVHPIKLTITNYPEGQSEELDAVNNPEDESAGTRKVPFGRQLWIEAEDFMEEPPKKFFRLAPGREVRLRYAYFITCDEVVKDDDGNIVELRCTYDPATKGGDAPDGRKVKATLHWVSAAQAVETEVRLYDRLFRVENPADVEEGQDWLDNLNPESLTVLPTCYVEPEAARLPVGASCQFERLGYSCVDPESTHMKPVFNRTVTLRDVWAKLQKRG